jgi:hypothetical protein
MLFDFLHGEKGEGQQSDWIRRYHRGNLLKYVLFQIGTMFVPNLDVGDMQAIANLLDRFRFASRCSGQCKYSEVGVLVHEFSDNLCVGVITLALMRLIYVSVVG